MEKPEASTISGMPSPSKSQAARLIMPRKIAGDDVPLPAGVFEPHQLGHAARERDQVGLAVVIHVHGDHLVAALQTGGDGVLDEPRRGGSGGDRAAQQDPVNEAHEPV